MKKGNYFGTHRVIYPDGLLPQAAERIDNNPEIFSNEILIEVSALQPTATAFGVLKRQCGEHVDKMSEAIMKIVEARGKFQEPTTKSGGILIGTVKAIGPDLEGKTTAKVGDKIATLVSLSLTPLKLKRITDIDFHTEQVRCEAEAILFESGIFTVIPEDLGDALTLAAMDVAGAPAQVAMHAKPNDCVTVIGAGKAGLLCLAEARRRVGSTGMVVCIEYSEAQCEVVRGLDIADVVIRADGQRPLDTYTAFIQATGGRLSDFTVSTVNVPDTELSAVLTTSDTGMIYFFSMSTDFAKASLGAEGAKKYVPMLIGNGYCPGHAAITFDLIRENQRIRSYFESRYCRQ